MAEVVEPTTMEQLKQEAEAELKEADEKEVKAVLKRRIREIQRARKILNEMEAQMQELMALEPSEALERINDGEV